MVSKKEPMPVVSLSSRGTYSKAASCKIGSVVASPAYSVTVWLYGTSSTSECNVSSCSSVVCSVSFTLLKLSLSFSGSSTSSISYSSSLTVVLLVAFGEVIKMIWVYVEVFPSVSTSYMLILYILFVNLKLSAEKDRECLSLSKLIKLAKFLSGSIMMFSNG